MKASFNILISALLCISLATAGSGAQAELLRTDSGTSTQREHLRSVLERPEVRARLGAAGVDAANIEARVAALTDEEVALLATQFEELPAGSGGDPRGLAAVALVAIAVYVVVHFWPFFLIGGVGLAAVKAEKRAKNS